MRYASFWCIFLIDLNFVRENIGIEIFTTKHNTFTKLYENIIRASRKVCIQYFTTDSL